jgi:hypothetical protein
MVPYALTTYNEQSWLEIKALFSNDSINLTLFSMCKTTAFLILALLGAPLLVQAETPARQHLFKIERSKNANIVQYDAQIGPDGKLMKKEPVVGYWIRLAEQGQVQKLSWIQRTFAYGFKAKLDSNREKVKLDMVADFGQPIFVIRNGDEYRATFSIEGSLSYLDKIFIQASGKGTRITIEYIEMFGEDLKTGETRYEKFFP